LHEMNNADKHREIQVLAFAVRGVRLRFGEPTTLTIKDQGFDVVFHDIGVLIKTGVPLKNGAKIGTIDAIASDDMDVNITIEPQIRFAKGWDAVRRRPVISTLNGMADTVSSIVEDFAPKF
jgi:hypothetical protein